MWISVKEFEEIKRQSDEYKWFIQQVLKGEKRLISGDEFEEYIRLKSSKDLTKEKK